MDATCAIQASIHVFSLVRKYVSRILGTYHKSQGVLKFIIFYLSRIGAHKYGWLLFTSLTVLRYQIGLVLIYLVHSRVSYSHELI